MPVFIVFLFAIMIFFPSVSPGEERGTTQVFETEGIAAVIGSDLARARDGAVRDALQKAVIVGGGTMAYPAGCGTKIQDAEGADL